MRIKRILFTLLVALMMFSLTAVASFALEINHVNLDATVEVNGSDLLDGKTSAVQPGSEIELTVKLPVNPGMAEFSLKIYYSADQLTYKDYENGVVFSQEPYIVPSAGLLTANFESSYNTATRGDVIVIKFAVAEDFHGDLSLDVDLNANPAVPKPGEDIVIYNVIETFARTYKVHNYGEPVIVDADCSNKGSVTYTCADPDCVDPVHGWDTDKALDNHSYTNYESDNNATCTADGTKTAKCDRCDALDTKVDEGTMLDHTFVTYTSNNDATCTKDGTKTAKCENCDAKDTKTDEGSKLDHTYVTYTSNGDATCTKDGTETAKCENCDAKDTKTDEGSKLPHTYVTYVSNNDATCTKDGTETAKCENCDAKDTKTDEGSMLDHTFVTYTSNNDATCTADGTETAKCENCDAKDTQPDVNSKLGHEFLAENYKSNSDATCTADGTKTAKCTRCDVTDTKTDEGTKLNHTYGAWAVTTQPTTSAQGEETRTCSACPAKETRPVKKLPVVVTAPTVAWEKGDGEMTFKSDADFADFEAVLVNGEVLAAENYTVKEGSIIVTLTEKYLKTLENGEYTICIKSANGSAESTFTVENSSGWIVAIIIIAAVVVCAGTVVGVVLYKKKKAA